MKGVGPDSGGGMGTGTGRLSLPLGPEKGESGAGGQTSRADRLISGSSPPPTAWISLSCCQKLSGSLVVKTGPNPGKRKEVRGGESEEVPLTPTGQEAPALTVHRQGRAGLCWEGGTLPGAWGPFW